MLVQKGASINVSTVSGLTPILLAGSALTPRYDVIKILIQNSANLESKTPLGTTVLMDVAGRAYEPETEELCYMLLRSGADLKQKDNKGRTAIDYAMSVCNMDVLKVLNLSVSAQKRLLDLKKLSIPKKPKSKTLNIVQKSFLLAAGI